MDANNPDLEIFRKQWQEEVTSRLKTKDQSYRGNKCSPYYLERSGNTTAKAALPPSEIPKEEAEPVDGISTQAYHDLEDKEDTIRSGKGRLSSHTSSQTPTEPTSALEHYEKAVEREDQGNLGDSLKLYRQAYRVIFDSKFQIRVKTS